MGIAIVWNLGAPTGTLLSGIEIGQPDLPWWVSDMLGWLTMVRHLQDSHLTAWRAQIEYTLENFQPTEVRGLYEDYVEAMRMEN